MSSLKSYNKIIRQASVEGIVFCTPTGEIEEEVRKQKQEQEYLKTLEEFWLDKGFQKGLEKGLQEGFRKGAQEGFAKGIVEGKEQNKQEMEQECAEKGLQEGYAKAKQELNHMFSLASDVAQKISDERQSTLDKLKSQLITLSFVVAEKILQRELASRDYFSQLIEQLLEQYKQTFKEQSLTVALAPQNFDAIQERTLENTLSEKYHLRGIHFIADENMHELDCRIEFPAGILHFNVKRQLEELQHKALEKTCE